MSFPCCEVGPQSFGCSNLAGTGGGPAISHHMATFSVDPAISSSFTHCITHNSTVFVTMASARQVNIAIIGKSRPHNPCNSLAVNSTTVPSRRWRGRQVLPCAARVARPTPSRSQAVPSLHQHEQEGSLQQSLRPDWYFLCCVDPFRLLRCAAQPQSRWTGPHCIQTMSSRTSQWSRMSQHPRHWISHSNQSSQNGLVRRLRLQISGVVLEA